MTPGELPPVPATDAVPNAGVADAMRALGAPVAPGVPARPTASSPRTVAGGRRRDHKKEYETRRAKIARDALAKAGAPVAPGATLPPVGAPASSERELRPEDLAPRGPNGQPLGQYELGVKSLAGAIKMTGELLAWWRGPHWRVTDDAPDHDATNLARVCAEAWPELLDAVGNAPQLVALAAIGAMVGPRLAEDRRLAALRRTETPESTVSTTVNGETVTAPVEGRGSGAGWMASQGHA